MIFIEFRYLLCRSGMLALFLGRHIDHYLQNPGA